VAGRGSADPRGQIADRASGANDQAFVTSDRLGAAASEFRSRIWQAIKDILDFKIVYSLVKTE
jgi:hypothetical protein